MSQEILQQLGDAMRMNVDDFKNINQGLSTQLMHSFLHASAETSSLNKIMKLYALPSNLSKMTVPKMNEEVEVTSAYQNNERLITTKEKSLYSLQNYVAKALAIISQMTDAVLNDADAKEKETSLNHKKVIQMGIHATTLLSHVQADMSQRRRNNIRNVVESQYVSLCGPKPGSKTAMEKPTNTDSEHLLEDDLKKAAKKAKTSNNMFKKSPSHHSSSNNHSKFKFPSNKSQYQDFLYDGHKTSSSNQKIRKLNNENSRPNYQTKNQYVLKTRK